MKFLLTAVLAILLVSCTKSSIGKDEITVCPEPVNLNWLNAKKAENSNCTICGVDFRYGIYNNIPVIEIRITSSSSVACDGVNLVYNMDGAVLLTSGTAAYDQYLQGVKDTQIIWSCK